MLSMLYMRVAFDSGHILELSPDHYFACVDPTTGRHASYVLGKDVRVGMAAAVEGSVNASTLLRSGEGAKTGVPAIVTGVTTIIRDGAFNPYTPSGTIIVAGVHSSCHSSWLFEGYPSLLPPTHVPKVYQALLTPVREFHRWAPRSSLAFARAFEGRAEGMGDASLREMLATTVSIGVHAFAAYK